MSDDGEMVDYEALADAAERGELRPLGNGLRGEEARAHARATLRWAGIDPDDPNTWGLEQEHSPSITTVEYLRRRERIEWIRHSTEMEGGRSSDEARALQDQWVRGEIDAHEVVARTRELYGLPREPQPNQRRQNDRDGTTGSGAGSSAGG